MYVQFSMHKCMIISTPCARPWSPRLIHAKWVGPQHDVKFSWMPLWRTLGSQDATAGSQYGKDSRLRDIDAEAARVKALPTSLAQTRRGFAWLGLALVAARRASSVLQAAPACVSLLTAALPPYQSMPH